MFCVLFQSPLTILLLLLHFVLILKKKKKMEKVYQCVVCDLEYGAKEILLKYICMISATAHPCMQ